MTAHGRGEGPAAPHPELLDRLLAAVRGRAPAAESFWRRCRRVRVTLDGGRPARASESVTEEVALRALVGGRAGFAAAGRAGRDDAGGDAREAGLAAADADDREGERWERLAGLVEGAVAAATGGPAAGFGLAPAAPPTPVSIFDPALAVSGARHVARLAQRLSAALGDAGGTGDAPGTMSVEVQDISVALHNTAGARAGYRKTVLCLSWDAPRGAGGASRGPAGVALAVSTLDAALRELGRRQDAPAAPRSRHWRPPAKRLRVILGPAAVAVFARALAAAACGRRAAASAPAPGAPRFDPALTLWDDATIDGAAQSAPWDAEGVPSRRTALVRGGAIVGALHDLQSAARTRAATSASARRAWLRPPAPRPSNIIVDGGARDLADLLADIGEGVVVLRLAGAPDAGGGYFLPATLAYRVKNGVAAGPAANFALRGNLLRDFSSLAGLSREVAWAGGDVLAPYLAVDGLEVVHWG